MKNKNKNKKMLFKLFGLAFGAVIFIFCFSFFASASVTENRIENEAENEAENLIPSDVWDGFEESIPQGVSEYFGDGAFADEQSFSSAIDEMTTPKAIVTVLLKLFGIEANALAKFMSSRHIIS